MLLKVSQVLLLHPDAPLLIEGHTDGKGPHANNLKLSENRAEAVNKVAGRQRRNQGITHPHGRLGGQQTDSAGTPVPTAAIIRRGGRKTVA